MDEKGQIVKRGKFSIDTQGLEKFMDGVDEALVAMEAGYCWQPIYDQLENSGHNVKLTHPKEVKAIAKARAKTDKIDSETLAHLIRADLIPESYVPPRDVRMLRDRVRLVTGILLGLDIFIFSRLSLQEGRIIFVSASLTVALIGYLGMFKRTDRFQRLE